MPWKPYIQKEDKYKVGKRYTLTFGNYSGVTGTIVASYTTHIEVYVLNKESVRVDRSRLVSRVNRGYEVF